MIFLHVLSFIFLLQDKIKSTLRIKQRNGNKIKCSDEGMELQLSALLGNYDRQTDRPTNQLTDGNMGLGGSYNSKKD